MTSVKRILVTGATGKQGGALINALIRPSPSVSTAQPPFHIIALTRDPSSRRAQQLAGISSVEVVKGDLNDIPSIFQTVGTQPLYGVFSVQTPLKPKVEEKQGKNLVDAAVAHGVQHFIYTSTERGGPLRSEQDATSIPHFISKFNIEKHLQSKCRSNGAKDMKYTIIRPVAFMDNVTPDFFGRVFASVWLLNGADARLQLVASKDIGILAADAFRNPELFTDKAISFATDELTFDQANAVFEGVVGRPMPVTYPLLTKSLKWALRDQLGIMFDWFKDTGFGADPQEYRSKYTEMMNFEEWLKKESKFVERT